MEFFKKFHWSADRDQKISNAMSGCDQKILNAGSWCDEKFSNAIDRAVVNPARITGSSFRKP